MSLELNAVLLNMKDLDLNTELIDASSNGDFDKVQYFLQNGANPNFISKLEDQLNVEDLVYRSTALMRAAHNGHLNIVLTLLNHLKYNYGKISTYWTVLVETIRNSALKRSSLMLNWKSEIKLTHDDIQNLSEFSLVSKHFRIMTYLIDVGADINQLLRNGLTPLMVVTNTGSIESMQYLLDHGATVDLLLYSNDKVMTSALICAVRANQKDAVLLLLNNGVKMDSLQCRCAFFIAVSKGNMEIIKLLVTHGIRPVMMQAYELYKIDLIDLNDITIYSDEVSPLYMALYSNQPDVAWYFMSIGFVTDFDVKDLSKQNDLRCRLEADESCFQSLEILNHLKNQPLPLVILTFVNVLESLSKSEQLSQSIRSLNIPTGMKTRLLFRRT